MSFDVDFSLTLPERRLSVCFATGGGITVLLGPSGVGKTTTLNIIAGLRMPEQGRVRVGERVLIDCAAGVAVPPQLRRAGYVFQDLRLFPHLRVRANLGFARQASPEEVQKVAMELGIAPLMDRWPRHLSGGEARRVAIARALLAAPDFLLLDEPFASLDGLRKAEAMDLVARLREERGLSMLLVTHDAREADRLADHVVTIERD